MTQHTCTAVNNVFDACPACLDLYQKGQHWSQTGALALREKEILNAAHLETTKRIKKCRDTLMALIQSTFESSSAAAFAEIVALVLNGDDPSVSLRPAVLPLTLPAGIRAKEGFLALSTLHLRPTFKGQPAYWGYWGDDPTRDTFATPSDIDWASVAALQATEASLPAEPKGGWMHATTAESEDWSMVLETKEAAIAEGREEIWGNSDHIEPDETDCFYVAQGKPGSYEEVYEALAAYEVLDTMREYFYENELSSPHEPALTFVDATLAGEEFRQWARKHIKISDWCVVDSKTIERVPRFAEATPPGDTQDP